MPKIDDMTHIFECEWQSYLFISANKIPTYQENDRCPQCGKGKLKFKAKYPKEGWKTFRCSLSSKCKKISGKKRFQCSVVKDSFFQNSKLGYNTMLKFIYLYLIGTSHSALMNILKLLKLRAKVSIAEQKTDREKSWTQIFVIHVNFISMYL